MFLNIASASRSAFAIVALLGMADMSPARAAAENVHVRGTIGSLEGSTLTVKTREGPVSAVTLKPGWKVTGRRRRLDQRHQAGRFCRHRFPANGGGRKRRGRSADFPSLHERDR